MMKAIGVTGAILVALLMMGAISIAGIEVFNHLSALYLSLDPQTARLAAISSAVALLCALIIAGAFKTSARNGVSAETAGLYSRLLAAWGERAKHPKGGGEADTELDELERLLALHGNAKVISAHLALRMAAAESKAEFHELLRRLTVEMRAELRGTRDWLDKNQLLDLLLNRHLPSA